MAVASLAEKRRAGYRFFCSRSDRKDFVVLVHDYTLYPEAKFPCFMEESLASICYTSAHKEEFGGGGILLMGQSVGAYIAMILALSKKYLGTYAIDPSTIKGWVSEAGQMNDYYDVQHFEKKLNPWLQRISAFSPFY